MGWISRKTEKGSHVARYRDPAGREHSKIAQGAHPKEIQGAVGSLNDHADLRSLWTSVPEPRRVASRSLDKMIRTGRFI